MYVINNGGTFDMRKIKDFFYDKNDIIIVLIILAAAAFIIYTRINVIMDYPEQLAREAAATEASKEEETTTESTVISLTIDDSDTIVTVSEELEAEGLVTSADDFEAYVEDTAEEDEEPVLKTGTFQIPEGASQEEITDIIIE